MRIITYLLSLSFLLFINSCKTGQKTVEQKTTDTHNVTFTTVGCNVDSVYLFKFDGITFKQLKKIGSASADTFQISIPKTRHQFYYIGLATNQVKPIVLGKESNVIVKANCQNMRQAKVYNSPINEAYNWGIAEARKNQGTKNSLSRQFQRAMQTKDNATIQKLMGDFTALDQKQLTLLDTLKSIDPFVEKIAASKTYLSYQNNKGDYADELGYFVVETFRHMDLKDPDLDHLPVVYEQFREFAQVLASIKLPNDLLKKHIDSTLIQLPQNSTAYKFALGGVAHGLQAKQNPAFLDYGTLFFEKYKNDGTAGIPQLEQQLNNARSFLTGAQAPDFTSTTPEGKALSLSDLKGKVVLIDFWASWCGPCRKENPNVVKVYNKYKEKGFDILGVSLDRKKDSWLKAIEKDGLLWHHVSDLKGWSNEVAGMYSVRSIPHTVLVDQEGNIIARNLRGPQLEQRLAQIFGE